jgi:arylsulfatase A-like enzyme
VTKPNIVFVLCDNVGWGDFGVYGGATPTPRIDRLANEGIRFNNYTVEAQCTPTRSAILTGRQSVRSGTFRVPFAGEGKAGLAPWEYTTATCFRTLGTRPRCLASGTLVTRRAGSNGSGLR